jgi:hypothetical protein
MVFIQILGILVLTIVVVLAAYLVVLRPRSHRWGATDAELQRSLPGDDLVPTVKVGYTQAITINAPPEEVWPWLVQIGYQRGGWYTYDWFYKLMGEDDFYDGNRSADRIIPKLQDLNVGDTINISKQMSFDVVALEQNRMLVLLARVDLDTGETFELSDTMPANFVNNGWVYVLEDVEANSTRLIVRWRSDYSPGLGIPLASALGVEGGALIFQPKTLKGIKARAEASGGQQREQLMRGQRS